jgi:hypothetical protein
MSRRRALMIVLVGGCLLLGGGTIEPTAPALASSTVGSRTAPRDLTNHFPLGPQHLCCQSTSQSQTSAAPPSSGASPGASSGVGGSGGSTHHSSSGFTVVVFWIIIGAAVAGLLAAGVADLRRAHRESPRALPPGITAAGYLERARAAADLVSRAQRERLAADKPPEVGAQERRHRERPRTAEEVVYRRADPLDRSRQAFNLGVALHTRGDVTGAVSAYARAERRGDPDASFNLGVLLCEAGELDAAEASWRRSADGGNARATEDLGVLVRRRRERGSAGPAREGADR